MRFPRMTTRRWMVAVAAVGVLLVFGPELLKFTPRGQRRLREAAKHASRAEIHREAAEKGEEVIRAIVAILPRLKARAASGLDFDRLADHYEERLKEARWSLEVEKLQTAFHKEMKTRYEAAARRLWEPDPQETLSPE